MEAARQSFDTIFLDRVRWAGAMSPEEKLLAGARLFELSAKIMAEGIRNEFPEADEHRVHETLLQRLALARRLEQPR
jgi:hypothetical protein